MDTQKIKDILYPAMSMGLYAALASLIANKELDLQAALIAAGLVFVTVSAFELQKHFAPKVTASKKSLRAKKKKAGTRLFLGYFKR